MRIRSFRNEKRNQYYFRVFNSNNDQVIKSEAYESKAARDNGIESFKKNAPLPERYERLTSADGKFYFNVKAGNHQVVATSLMFDTEEQREAVISEIIAYATSSSSTAEPQNLAASAPATESTSSAAAAGDGAKEADDYLDADFYQNSGTDTKSGFDRFQKGDHNYYYFSFKSDDDKVILLSQGYSQEAGRDNGIASVEKNGKIEKRYSHSTTDAGKYFFVLKAGNHQEIARSIDFDSEADMKRAMGILMNGGGTMAEPEIVKAVSNAGSANDSSKEEDDYMDADFYQTSGTDTKSGFDKFQKGDNNFYYFSFKSDDGQVLLLSQGYTQEAGRDNGIASVEKNGKIEKRYFPGTTENGKYFFILKAGNHQEIARSIDFDSEADMKRAMGIIQNGGGAMVEAEVVKAAPNQPEKASGADLDDYRTFGFYKDSGTDVQNGWDRFYSEKHSEYYFSYKVDGEPILISEGYKSEKARENGIASVEKNWGNSKRYKHHETKSGRYYYTIVAGNHQEIARSKWYSSAEERDGGVSWIMASGAAGVGGATMAASNLMASDTPAPTPEPVIEKTVEPTPEAVVEKEPEDDYLPCKAYEGHPVNDKVNNVAFFKHENGQYYFVVYKENGNVRLRSEGFQTAKGRDEELSGMLKNIDNESMYKTIERGKYKLHILHDATGREVGRSCLEKEEVAAPPVVETAAAAAVATAVVSNTVETKTEKEDDYLNCREYEGHPVNDKVNNIAFFKHKNGQYYFVAYKEDGSVRLRSEGFQTAKGRDEELSGMLKNMDNPDMYETISKGKYKLHILKDKTGREVGRSCLETVEVKAAPPVIETATAAAVAAAAVSEVIPEKEPDKEDDYLPCKEYEGHKINDKKNNVALFKHSDGQLYFVVYKQNGDVRLRSEGFRTSKERDSELSAAIKNMNNADMYETISRGKYSLHILKDKTGREVGRSCLETEPVAANIPVVETIAAAAAVAAVSEVIPEKEPDKEDDYLPCKEYEGHKINDKKNNVALFKHSDGQLYFVVYKQNGDVRLRSEGFRTSKERDSELSAAIKNMNNADMYETISRGKYSLHILKDKTGREVGRSCLETEPVAANIPVIETVAAAATAAAVISKVPVETEVVAPVVKKTVKKPVAAVPPAAPVAAAASGGFNWLWLLLPLLLLGFLFWKGCFGCGEEVKKTVKTEAPIEKVPEKTIPPVVADTTEKVVKEVPPPAPVAPTCNCTGSSNVVFNIPSGRAAKTLTVLGTNPEFGNSHSLDAAGFYNKLKNAHANNARDKRFLNNLFKSMGYTNGFSDANAGLFSNTSVPYGTTGNMGYSSLHRTVYAKLNTSGKDLEAFRIKAANGCDIHFMKTCGNHFFFCPN